MITKIKKKIRVAEYGQHPLECKTALHSIKRHLKQHPSTLALAPNIAVLDSLPPRIKKKSYKKNSLGAKIQARLGSQDIDFLPSKGTLSTTAFFAKKSLLLKLKKNILNTQLWTDSSCTTFTGLLNIVQHYELYKQSSIWFFFKPEEGFQVIFLKKNKLFKTCFIKCSQQEASKELYFLIQSILKEKNETNSAVGLLNLSISNKSKELIENQLDILLTTPPLPFSQAEMNFLDLIGCSLASPYSLQTSPGISKQSHQILSAFKLFLKTPKLFCLTCALLVCSLFTQTYAWKIAIQKNKKNYQTEAKQVASYLGLQKKTSSCSSKQLQEACLLQLKTLTALPTPLSFLSPLQIISIIQKNTAELPIPGPSEILIEKFHYKAPIDSSKKTGALDLIISSPQDVAEKLYNTLISTKNISPSPKEPKTYKQSSLHAHFKLKKNNNFSR